ncbi:MAG: nucleotidyl transferase AbiEii/AbiGii toxin family protein [Elusimicrobiota bacterium]
MKTNIPEYQQKVLEGLAGKIDDFCLGGGTALSIFYFRHRESEDMDFFSSKFDKKRIVDVAEQLSQDVKRPVEIIGQQLKKNMVRVMVYSIKFEKKNALKIDFIEDNHKYIKKPHNVNGICIMSMEDIYLRKISTVAGFSQTTDPIGKSKSIGGRREAKDFCDLYFLSHTFMGLADFAWKHCDNVIRENLIIWFRTYDRMEMKMGLMDLKLKKQIDYRDMEKHFKKEIDRLIEREVFFI